MHLSVLALALGRKGRARWSAIRIALPMQFLEYHARVAATVVRQLDHGGKRALAEAAVIVGEFDDRNRRILAPDVGVIFG